MSGIKKASFARFFDTTDSIGSVVPIERLSKNIVFDSLNPGADAPGFLSSDGLFLPDKSAILVPNE
nr:hypothetical protein [uncultured Agathobaculum sp.]